VISGSRLLERWEACRRWPGGKWLFSRLIGLMVPYSASIRGRVEELGPGYARLSLRERRAIRQHLGSVHAVALVNLGELTSGLAMTAALPEGARAIVLRISAEYVKKARGLLTAESTVRLPGLEAPVEHPVQAEIRNAAGEPVCRVAAVWRIDRTGGPGPHRS